MNIIYDINCTKEKYPAYYTIDTRVQDFIDIIFKESEFDGYVFIGMLPDGLKENTNSTKVQKKGLSQLPPVKLLKLKEFMSTLLIDKSTNYYITRNTFRSSGFIVHRDKASLFSLNNIVIDIDCHKDFSDMYADNPEMFNKAIYTLQDFIKQNELVSPNIIVKSGRGLQLWYHFTPFSSKIVFNEAKARAKILVQINAIMYECPDVFEGFTIDYGAANNQCGFYRIPYTYNTSAKKYSELVILTSESYDIHEIINSYNPDPINEITKKAIYNKANNTSRKILPFIIHSIRSNNRCYKILDTIKDLRNTRPVNYKGCNIHENRWCYCYGLMSFAVNCMPSEDALNYVKDFNNGFKFPLFKDEIEYLLDYCTTKTYDEKTNKKLTLWTNKYIIEYYNLSNEEQIKYNIIYTANFVYDKSKTKQSIARVQNQEKKIARNELITNMLLSKEHTQQDISRLTGVSLRTINRISHTIPTSVNKPWEDLGIPRSTYYYRRNKLD